MKAAKKAGIHPITLIKEPEAAALYTLHTMVDRSLAVGLPFSFYTTIQGVGGTKALLHISENLSNASHKNIY